MTCDSMSVFKSIPCQFSKVNAENTVEHKYLSIRYTEVCMKKIIKQKKKSYLDGKTVFTYVSGLYSGYF